MSAEPHRPDDDKVIHTARACHALDLRDAPRQHSLRTPQCPSLARFGEAVPARWTPEEEQHVRACPYCRKVLTMFAHPEEAGHGPSVAPPSARGH